MERAVAAEAAERRAQASTQGLSEETVEALRLRRQKDDLVGKIEHYYRTAGREPPFGLNMATVEALRKQQDYAKTLTAVERQ